MVKNKRIISNFKMCFQETAVQKTTNIAVSTTVLANPKTIGAMLIQLSTTHHQSKAPWQE